MAIDRKKLYIISSVTLALLLLTLFAPMGRGRIIAAILLLPLAIISLLSIKKRVALSINTNQVLLIFSVIGLKKVGLIILGIFALLGYVIGAFKIPTIVGLPVTKKIGGESIYEIILRYIKFNKNRKIYTNTKEEK